MFFLQKYTKNKFSMKIINNQIFFGRSKEIKLIEESLNSNKAEFVAVYGKRRVGKTFLLHNVLNNYLELNNDCCFLKLNGIINSSNKFKINKSVLLIKEFINNYEIPLDFDFKNLNWIEIFNIIEKIAIYLHTQNKKFIIFIDEIPWLSDRNGEFLSSLSASWNDKLTHLKGFKLFVSGSATNWIIKKILRNKGALHRRLTQEIKLLPFTFQEHQEYVLHQNKYLSDYNVYLLYLIFGGVPYYLSLYNYNESVEFNIKTLFSGLLKNEFDELLSSLFSEKSYHKEILTILSNNTGYQTKQDIVSAIKNKKVSSQTISNNLDELLYCGFIKTNHFFKNKSHNTFYKINDNFIYFYLKQIQNNYRFESLFDTNSQSFAIWSGYAFELFLSNQIEFLKEKMGIKDIKTIDYSWRSHGYDKNCQIDLVIERSDNIIHIVEAKFYNHIFILNDDYRANLNNKLINFKDFLSTQRGYVKKSLSIVIVSLFGTKNNDFREIKLID